MARKVDENHQEYFKCQNTGWSGGLASLGIAAMIQLDPKKDWPNDTQQYLNKCVHCGEVFSGYKRRIECQECAKEILKRLWAENPD